MCLFNTCATDGFISSKCAARVAKHFFVTRLKQAKPGATSLTTGSVAIAQPSSRWNSTREKASFQWRLNDRLLRARPRSHVGRSIHAIFEPGAGLARFYVSTGQSKVAADVDSILPISLLCERELTRKRFLGWLARPSQTRRKRIAEVKRFATFLTAMNCLLVLDQEKQVGR